MLFNGASASDNFLLRSHLDPLKDLVDHQRGAKSFHRFSCRACGGTRASLAEMAGRAERTVEADEGVEAEGGLMRYSIPELLDRKRQFDQCGSGWV